MANAYVGGEPADLALVRQLASLKVPLTAADSTPSRAITALGAVSDIQCAEFQVFDRIIDEFARIHGLQGHSSDSKAWEYPWLWFNALQRVNWIGKRVIDIGSGASPMPWLIAALGAEVVLIETTYRWVALWNRLAPSSDCYESTGRFRVDWRIVADEHLPFPNEAFDVVTSLSVIEHQPDKRLAVAEAVRVLKPGGLLAISFDLCEPSWGMTFPSSLGAALTRHSFQELIWDHPELDTGGAPIAWNSRDCLAFMEHFWDKRPDGRYGAGAAVLPKLRTRYRRVNNTSSTTKPSSPAVVA